MALVPTVSFRWCPSPLWIHGAATGELDASNLMPSFFQNRPLCQPSPGGQEELGWMPAAPALVFLAPGESLAGNGIYLLIKLTKVLGNLFYEVSV